MNARFVTNEFALTYPRCEMSPAGALEQLKRRFDEKAEYLAVVREAHKEGGNHLHAQIQFAKPYNATERTFDLMDNSQVYHPNVQKVKDSEDWRAYIAKEGIPEISGIFRHLKKKKGAQKKPRLTNKELLEADLVKLVDEDKISLFSLQGILNGRKLYEEMQKPKKKQLPEFLPVNWLESSTGIAAMMYLKDKKEKQRHYWIYSDRPNKGKTTYLQLLREEFATSDYSAQEKYQTVNKESDLLLFDEFGKGNSVTYTVMNQICDGTYKYPIKGKPAVIMEKPYVIVASNFSISEVYPNSFGRIEARFNELSLNNKEFL